MKKPIIGITPLYDSERSSYWMLPGYMTGLESVGAIPVMLPLTADRDELKSLCSVCSGFLFTGGQDVSPSIYGEKTKPSCGEVCTMRDKTEQILLSLALESDKPILGICRGLQFINAALGGSLYQDLPDEYPSHVQHHMSPPYDRAVHTVSITPGSLLSDIISSNTIGVNSYHHQAVKTLAPSLSEAARAEDGIIESAYMPGKRFVLAVQWHPEFSYKSDENSKNILRAFADAAKK